MSQHTPGRLTLVTQYAQPELRDASGELVAVIPAYKVENARRLATCWNACDGIPTNELEGKSIDEYVSQQAFITGMNPSPEGMDLGVKGLAAQMMAASFAGQFIGNSAVNYLEMRFLHPDVGPFTVTIQRTQGLTPAQRLKQVETQRGELLKALRMWVDIHETPAGFASKYGKALDAAIAAQQLKVDAAASASRAAIASVEGGAYSAEGGSAL